MKARFFPVLLALLAAPAVSAPPVPEAVFEKRAGLTARKILSRSDRVVIAGFRVAFQFESVAAAGRRVTLAGVDGEDFQRITEEAYADFKAQLTREGLTVLDPAVLRASPGYGMLAFTPCSPARPPVRELGAQASVAVFTPAALPLFFGHFDGDALAGATDNLDNWRALNRLSVETRAVVLVPTLVVDFIGAKSAGRGRPAAEEATPQIALVPRLTGVAVLHAKLRLAGDLGRLPLGEPLAVPGFFGTLRAAGADDPAGPGRAGEVLVARPADYSRLSLDAVRTFNRTAGAFIAEK